VIREVLLNIGHLLQRSDLLSFRLCTRTVRCQRLVRVVVVRIDEEEIDDMILRVSTWDLLNDLGVQSALITDGDDIEVGDTLINERAG